MTDAQLLLTAEQLLLIAKQYLQGKDFKLESMFNTPVITFTNNDRLDYITIKELKGLIK